ncbi:MAG: FKBP-type peptidyl-prolyl cis-trans isomerase [Bacteroidales bacterium]|jgi:FKBP-type peptidyl-prolyl cis-trans isomerase FklB|nr:FKBP-type peptidyl-prolyl cis-trans isomerase [Bacteroidales bacterium]
MKNLFLILTLTGLIFSTVSCKSQNKVKEEKVQLKTDTDRAAYSLGVSLGNNFKQQGLDTTFNIDVVIAGLREQLSNTSQIKVEETEAILNKYFQGLQEAKSKPAIEKGKKFLEENGKRKEVTTTISGLQYEIIKDAQGLKPTATDKVKVHYHGTLLDGTVFDSSVDRGEPISFPLNGVIRGWTEGLQLMSVGAKYRFYIPYDLAYGERGAGGQIGPYETLIFEVELLGIEK